ncbi:MAG: hypothetical protein BGN95_16000 [Sphingomonas sp. 66-10]|nr:MAG: hypothetical protein BGN95_16000 [Sphingomonas sp. 66-10]
MRAEGTRQHRVGRVTNLVVVVDIPCTAVIDGRATITQILDQRGEGSIGGSVEDRAFPIFDRAP